MWSEAELSQVLRDAFQQYGSEIAQAFNVPSALKPLVADKSAVVSVELKRGRLVVSEFDVDGQEAEIVDLKRQVREKETEIQSLTLLLEKQKSEQPMAETIGSLEPTEGNSTDLWQLGNPDKKEKPKRKRNRRKAEVNE